MPTKFREQINASILDTAAGLIARNGDKTSVQDVAVAVGLSKAGLQYHFPTKEAIHEGILDQARELRAGLIDQVRDLPLGAPRDLAVIEAIVDAALAHPGLVAMMMLRRGSVDRSEVARAVFIQGIFGDDPDAVSLERKVRIKVAMGSVAVLTQSTPPAEQTTTWRRILVAACFNALGHSRPGPFADVPTYPEA